MLLCKKEKFVAFPLEKLHVKRKSSSVFQKSIESFSRDSSKSLFGLWIFFCCATADFGGVLFLHESCDTRTLRHQSHKSKRRGCVNGGCEFLNWEKERACDASRILGQKTRALLFLLRPQIHGAFFERQCYLFLAENLKTLFIAFKKRALSVLQ